MSVHFLKASCFWVLLAATPAPASNLVAKETEVLAKVGDTVITAVQFKEALASLGQQGEMILANPELKKRFLDHMINSRLVAKLAKKEGFENDAKYKSRLQDVAEQLLAGEYMDRTLEKKLTDASVEKYFNEHKSDFSKKEIKASHVLLATEEEAKKVQTEVSASGADFDAIAKKHSKDKSVDLGFFTRGRMVPEFEKAAFATPKGKIYPQPVKTTFGWHVIKVTDVKGDDKVDFAKIKDEVKAKYRTILQEELMRGLREKTAVTINDDTFKKL